MDSRSAIGRRRSDAAAHDETAVAADHRRRGDPHGRLTGDFTMPGLAQRLKVRPSSLYNHVSGRAEIVELVRAQMMSQINLMVPRMRRGPRWWGHWRASIGAATPGTPVHPAVHRTHGRGGGGVRDVQRAGLGVRGRGYPPEQILHAITAVDSFVLGSALDLAAPEVVWESGPEANDAMRAALATSVPNPERADAAFEFGARRPRRRVGGEGAGVVGTGASAQVTTRELMSLWTRRY